MKEVHLYYCSAWRAQSASNLNSSSYRASIWSAKQLATRQQSNNETQQSLLGRFKGKRRQNKKTQYQSKRELMIIEQISTKRCKNQCRVLEHALRHIAMNNRQRKIYIYIWQSINRPQDAQWRVEVFKQNVTPEMEGGNDDCWSYTTMPPPYQVRIKMLD